MGRIRLCRASGPHAQGRCGYGPRLPLLVISPFAKQNYVDHTMTDQTSILRFIEDNWLEGQRIGKGSFDAVAGTVNGMFDFSRHLDNADRHSSGRETGEPIKGHIANNLSGGFPACWKLQRIPGSTAAYPFLFVSKIAMTDLFRSTRRDFIKAAHFLRRRGSRTCPSCGTPELLHSIRTLATFVDPLPVPLVTRQAHAPILSRRGADVLTTACLCAGATLRCIATCSRRAGGLAVRSRRDHRGPQRRAALVEWANELPQQHFLPIDHTLHGAEAHNRRCARWCTFMAVNAGSRMGTPRIGWRRASRRTASIPDQQDPAMLWYHDHTMGINRLNMYAGMFGSSSCATPGVCISIYPPALMSCRC